MMNDLDTLRPEVRAAMEAMDADVQTLEWLCIRAELLRLADENETLERAASKHVLRCIELQAILDTVLPKECAASERAEKAEAELAALKARIADAPMAVVQSAPGAIKTSFHGYGCFEYTAENLQPKLRGKRVRLVVEE